MWSYLPSSYGDVHGYARYTDHAIHPLPHTQHAPLRKATMPLHFYDSANPQSVPTGVHAAVYINGAFVWRQRDIDRMEAVFRITVREGSEWAGLARCIDIESGDATPAGAMSFLIARHRRNGDATAYVNRSNMGEVRSLCSRAGIPVRLWVATLDGTQDVIGAWAVQYQGGQHAAFDLSVLHGVNDFHAP